MVAEFMMMVAIVIAFAAVLLVDRRGHRTTVDLMDDETGSGYDGYELASGRIGDTAIIPVVPPAQAVESFSSPSVPLR